MSSWNDDSLVSLRESLKLNVLMRTGLINKLEKAAGGFMSRSEAQKVRGLSSDSEQIDEVIEILRGKGDEDFCTFCTILHKSNYGNWAAALEREAQRLKKERGRGMC